MTLSTFVTSVNLVMWSVVGFVTVWRVLVLIPRTGRSRGRVMVAAQMMLLFLSITFLLEPVMRRTDEWVPGAGRLLLNVGLVWTVAALLAVFALAFTTRAWPRAVAAPRYQGVLAVATTVGLVVIWAVDPAGLVGPQLVPPRGPVTAYLFCLLACTYVGYAFVVSACLAKAQIPHSPARWRRGLAICALGLGLDGVVTLGRLPMIPFAWLGQLAPPWVEAAAQVLVALGTTPLVIGLFLVAAESAAAEARLWWRAKRDTIALCALWTRLYCAFPQIALHSPRGRLHEALRVRWVPYTHRRRIAECRDGLWLLSRYVDGGRDATADDVRTGLERVHAGRPGDGPGWPMIAGDPDREEQLLLDLSRDLRRGVPAESRPVPSPASRIET